MDKKTKKKTENGTKNISHIKLVVKGAKIGDKILREADSIGDAQCIAFWVTNYVQTQVIKHFIEKS